jgi:hypothetical protein
MRVRRSTTEAEEGLGMALGLTWTDTAPGGGFGAAANDSNWHIY